MKKLAGFQPELIVVAAFGSILPPEVLSLPKFACLNVHASLLPRHRGPSPVANTILCGDGLTGVTIMLMDAGLDTGPILAQEKVGISFMDTAGSLASRLADVGAKLLVDTFPKWVGGELEPRPQDETQATCSRLITSKDAEIDWHLSALQLWRMVRAYNPWPSCHTWCRGKRLKILRVWADTADKEARKYAIKLGLAVPKATRAIAPTGTIAILAGTTGGAEPLFCKAYKRSWWENDKYKYSR